MLAQSAPLGGTGTCRHLKGIQTGKGFTGSLPPPKPPQRVGGGPSQGKLKSDPAALNLLLFQERAGLLRHLSSPPGEAGRRDAPLKPRWTSKAALPKVILGCVLTASQAPVDDKGKPPPTYVPLG